MPTRYRQVHNIWGLYSGPAPAYSGHYADYNNDKFNTGNLGLFDHNLLEQIDRVQNFSYGFNIDRVNLSQLGKRSLVGRHIVNRPSIEVSFSYLMAGVRNEDRLGFIANYPDATNTPVYDEEICCFKNFTGQSTDFRNLFLAVSPDNNDINERIEDYSTPGELAPENLFVFGFGNCYINSYSVRAAVGQFPEASIGYVCDNIIGYSSGGNANIPAVYPKSGNLVDSVKFTIPRAESIVSPSVIKPQDITIEITQNTGAFFGISSSGVPIQSFDISTQLDREELRSIGYVLPIDRRINFPIFVDINISSIVDNNISGNLINKLHDNEIYNLLINMYNPGCSGRGDRDIAVQYKIQNAHLTKTEYAYNINNNLVANFGFQAEIDIDNPTKGMYISGVLNAPFPENSYGFLILENNQTGTLGTGFLLTEDTSDPLIILNTSI